MDQFMETLTSNVRKESVDNLWSSFCNNKNKSSVKMISRNGISTKRNNLTKDNLMEMLRFSDSDVQSMIKNATDEMFKRNQLKLGSNVLNVGEISRPTSSHKVTQLTLSPEKKKPLTAKLPEKTVEQLSESEDSTTEYREPAEPQRLRSREELTDNAVLADLDITEIESPRSSAKQSPMKFQGKVEIIEKEEVVIKNPYLEIVGKLCDLREKIIYSLEDIKSSLLPSNQIIETDDIEIAKQKKRSLGFGMRFSRNHLYQISRLIDEIRFTEGQANNNNKIVSLHNSILQAAITFFKGTVNFAVVYSAEKLQDFINLVVNAMKVEKCYDDEDPEGKDQAKTVIDICNSLGNDLKKLKASEMTEKKPKPVKSKKKSVPTNVIKTFGKANNLSMYNSSIPANKVQKISKSPRKRPVKKTQNLKKDDAKPTETIAQQEISEVKSVNINSSEKINTNFQEALLDILREMTKQQMQQIFRPVLNDIEMLLKDKAPQDEKSTNDFMKRINEFLASHDSTAFTKSHENTDVVDDKKLEPPSDMPEGKVVQGTCNQRTYQSQGKRANKYLIHQTLAGQVQNDKLEFLQKTSKNPMYGNETFARPWSVIARTSDNLITEMTEEILNEGMLDNVAGFVNGFLKVEMMCKGDNYLD